MDRQEIIEKNIVVILDKKTGFPFHTADESRGGNAPRWHNRLCTAINFRHYPDGRILALGNFQKIQKRVDLADTLESTFLVAQLISNLRGDEWLNTFKYLSKTKYPLQRIVKTFFPNTITPEAKQILLDTVKKYNETYGFPLDKDGEPFIPPPQKSWIRKVISKWF